MPNLKSIRKRIASVKNTQQITRAMKMVAAAKLRKAQDRIVAAKPFAEKMDDIVHNLAGRVGEEITHPLLEAREVKKVNLLLFTSDRGLCGAFNTNMIKAGERYIAQARAEDREVVLTCVGRKGIDYFSKRKYDIKEKYLNLGSDEDFETAKVIARNIIESYVEKEFDLITMLFSEFFSPVKQRPFEQQLLPVLMSAEEDAAEPTGELPSEYIFEPPADKLLAKLLPQSVEVQVYRAILDNLASEFGARMSAMENATNNADDMIKSLTLSFNRARQEAITTELMDIVGGAEAQAK